MSKKWLGLLAVLVLAGCGKQVKLTSAVALRHAHEAAIQRQAKLLQAKEIQLTAQPAASGDHHDVLMLQVIGVNNQPGQGDSLRQRVRKLAHLVAVDLAAPGRYEAMTIGVSKRVGLLKPDESLPTLIYPLAALR